ncbi:MAG: TlpA family protein disulfide reductase [Polyangiaceae bacterium]|nr:TlpA family protein disulfide reductase [Polyangiaceae bacterium]MCE7890397.1 TlpA family protein disulfide reductase [Sorangiineae bacterium PRO1]MCL4751442.1 TlpA family protein disulfide reductase [Myxococcales bacterium]
MPRFSRFSAGLILLSGLASCRPTPEPLAADRPDTSRAPVEFAFGTTDGTELSSATTRGRATAVLFVTTYDLASQVMAQRLESVLHSHVPRANAGAVVLEAPKYAQLAAAYRSTLALSYPVAMADSLTLTGGGPFGTISQVPTLVVLDRSGREVWRRSGVPDSRDIEQALALGSRRGSAPPP